MLGLTEAQQGPLGVTGLTQEGPSGLARGRECLPGAAALA